MKKRKYIVCLVIVAFLICIIIIFWVNKSKSNIYISSKETIEKTEIFFQTIDGMCKRIDINFQEHTKSVTEKGNCIEDGSSVHRDMEQQIQEILRNINFGYKDKRYNQEEDQAVLWSICVWTKDNFYIIDAFEDEGYPQYWNGLMNLIGITEWKEK